MKQSSILMLKVKNDFFIISVGQSKAKMKKMQLIKILSVNLHASTNHNQLVQFPWCVCDCVFWQKPFNDSWCKKKMVTVYLHEEF